MRGILGVALKPVGRRPREGSIERNPSNENLLGSHVGGLDRSRKIKERYKGRWLAGHEVDKYG